ncbi:MAG: hypothetical protein O3B01_18220 [Planctomycetota bacterium]|nr:hypothetical protein [Planctomycetota bacterium]
MIQKTLISCGLTALFLSFVHGDEPEGPTSQQVAEWISQLESDKFPEREAATTKLVAAGSSAIAPLEKAMKSGKAETGTRGMTILEQLAGAKDKPTSTAAAEALRRLGVDEDKISALSNEPKKETGVATSVIHFGGGAGGVIQIGGGAGGGLQVVPGQVILLGGGQATISVGVTTAVGAKGDSVSVTTVNGVKTITVTETARTVEIKELPEDALELVITTKVDGKTKTEKIEAKNAEDLEKQHPKLYALYKKHAGK